LCVPRRPMTGIHIDGSDFIFIAFCLLLEALL